MVVFLNTYLLLLLSLFFNLNLLSKEKKKVTYTNRAFFYNQKEKDSILQLQYKKALILFENKKYIESLKLLLSFYEKSKLNNDTKIHYDFTYLIAEIYRKNRDHNKSVEYYKKSLNLLLRNHEDSRELYVNNDKYFAKNFFRIGAQYQLLSINDSATFYYEKLVKLSSKDDDILDFQANSYSNLAGIYQKDTTMLNHYTKAVEFAERAIAIHKKRNNKQDESFAINNLANVYLLQGDFEKSKKTYLEGIKLIKRDTTTRAIRIKGTLYSNLAWAMRNLKEYEAYDELITSVDLENKLLDLETKEMLERVTGEYNVDVVRKAGEFEKQKAENLTWIIGTSSVAIILLLAFFLNQYKLRQQNLSLQLINKETASQLEVLNATLAGEETARKQISQELHDGILGKLFGSRMGLGYLELQASTETQLKYESLLNELQHIEQEIRDVSHKLHYNFSSVEVYFIKNIDLQLQEKSLLGNFSYKLQIDKKLSWKNIASDIKLELYRILQECFQNILKHAKPSKVLLDFKLANKQLLVELVDDGIGFNTNQQFKGIGLKNIQVRAEKIGGSIQVLSEKTKGTTIQIKIPMSEHG